MVNIEGVKCQATKCKHHDSDKDSICQCRLIAKMRCALFTVDESGVCKRFVER